MNSGRKENPALSGDPKSFTRDKTHGRIVAVPDLGQCLDTIQFDRLEQSFREWADSSPRADVRTARRRILIIFLLIRYTGAKLNEVLALNPSADIDPKRSTVVFHDAGGEKKNHSREIQISEVLCHEIQATLTDPTYGNAMSQLAVDPAFVRRKFYERAQACGLAKRRGGPEMIRKSRAVELMRGNVPLPAVQMILGHSTPNLTSAYVTFSADEIQEVTRRFVEREAARRTSARNSFFGKIQAVRRGDIQSRVDLVTISGYSIVTIITNDSLDRLGLKKGGLITAEVKAPWVILQRGDSEPDCSAENRFHGLVARINSGKVNTEYTVRIDDGTELCAVVSSESRRRLALRIGDRVWALFTCFAVVLHVD